MSDLTCRCRGEKDTQCWFYPVEWDSPFYDTGYPTPATQEDGLCDGCRENECVQVPFMNPLADR